MSGGGARQGSGSQSQIDHNLGRGSLHTTNRQASNPQAYENYASADFSPCSYYERLSMRIILEAMESLDLPLDDQRAEYDATVWHCSYSPMLRGEI